VSRSIRAAAVSAGSHTRLARVEPNTVLGPSGGPTGWASDRAADGPTDRAADGPAREEASERPGGPAATSVSTQSGVSDRRARSEPRSPPTTSSRPSRGRPTIGRRLRRRISSMHAFVAMRYSQVPNELLPSKRPMPRTAARSTSWVASRASVSLPSIRRHRAWTRS
jgi:hypothetical protein